MSGSFFKIDSATGSGAFIGNTGFIGTNSLACDGSGKLYSVAGSGTAGRLITVDPQTGAATLVKQLQPPQDIRDLAFSPEDVLFGINHGGGPDDIESPDDLVTIDVATGAVTPVGNTGQAGLQGLAFSPNGTLYGWGVSCGLATINPTTGVATLVNSGAPTGSQIQALAFAPNGTLFGAWKSLFTINVTTGTPMLIGSGGYSDIRGIAFFKSPQLFRPLFIRLAWAWTILIGYILVTPIGPLCIACATPLSDFCVRLLGISVLVLGGVGLLHEIRRPQTQDGR